MAQQGEYWNQDTSPVEERMKPGKSSSAGFLGEGETLSEVIARDSELLKDLGISHERVAVELGRYAPNCLAGFAYFERFRSEKIRECIQGKVRDDSRGIRELDHVTWRGSQACPYDDGRETNRGIYLAREMYLGGIRSSVELHFSGLLPHLIAEHRFFEGNGTHYRREPLELISFFDIESPRCTRADIHLMWYRGICEDIESMHPAAMERAIMRIAYFTHWPRTVDMLHRGIDRLLDLKCKNDFRFWSCSFPLIQLAVKLGAFEGDVKKKLEQLEPRGVESVLRQRSKPSG